MIACYPFLYHYLLQAQMKMIDLSQCSVLGALRLGFLRIRLGFQKFVMIAYYRTHGRNMIAKLSVVSECLCLIPHLKLMIPHPRVLGLGLGVVCGRQLFFVAFSFCVMSTNILELFFGNLIVRLVVWNLIKRLLVMKFSTSCLEFSMDLLYLDN